MPKRGTRVELIHTTDMFTTLEPGATGTVQRVDDVGTVHIHWDDGTMLGLVPGEDQWWELPGAQDAPQTVVYYIRVGREDHYDEGASDRISLQAQHEAISRLADEMGWSLNPKDFVGDDGAGTAGGDAQ